MPKISFIIPYYNVPTPLLKECVESILALSLKAEEREIIVVDDGSKESPMESLEAYGSSIVCIRQENGGLSAARNTGIAHATGEYIQFVDADDTLLPQDYNTCLTLLKEHQPDILLFRFTDKKIHPISYSSPSLWEGRGGFHPIFGSSPSLREGWGGCDYLRTHNLRAAAWSYVFRKDILGDLRFTPGLLHEDEEFTPLLFLRAQTVIDTPLTAYYYRQREDSIVHRPDAAHIQKRLDDVEHIIDRLSKEDGLERRVAQLTMDYLYNMMRLAPSFDDIEVRVSRLKDKGLYPLPLRRYTLKYWLFSLVARKKTGLRLLFCSLNKQ